ncbi:hypothetical protein [Rhizobium sp. CSW-27]|uniref:hypothetical protein n=1 Tax=Rhizobium sp. CSW-27 TaxID=2839985 RepID=UPI001C0232FA|nr:hypothetical protein [Rhizobium sp. CSW-27]MBT9368938.1 hypothetical protein [Rhizobium sp. CSW-27]
MLVMRRFAFPIAVIAWLFTSLMPALALPSAQDHAGHAPVMEAMPHAAAVAAHPPAGAGAHDHAAKTTPCPGCDGKPVKVACAMSLCAACTSLVPELMLAAFRPAMADHPAALPISALTGMAPGPADPPPRA